MMDRIVPGGVTADLDRRAGHAGCVTLTEELRAAMPRLVKLYDETPSLQDRTVTTGILRPDLAKRFAPGGYVGRASGPRFRCAPRSGLCAV